MFHLSDIKKYTRCDRYFYLNHVSPLPYFPYAVCNESTLALACQYLALNEQPFYEGKTGDEGSLVLEALDQYDVFVGARFVYQDLRVTIPILIRQENGFQVFFTSNQIWPKESEWLTLTIACRVLELNGCTISDVKMFHPAADYVRGDELDVHRVLMLDDHLYHDKKRSRQTLMEGISETEVNLDLLLEHMREALESEPKGKTRSSICTHRGKCDYFDWCFPQYQADDSVFNLVQSAHKYELMAAGKVNFGMLEGDEIEATRHQYAQIMAARNGGFYMDDHALASWIERKIVYPITYLDFEWETYVYPPYAGMKPYDVLVFQYSMHVEETENAPLSHEQFIGTGDCRITFIEDLLAKIPPVGSIMVYNALGGEVLRLKQLAEQFPQYASRLQAVWERMVDLSIPFSSGNVYDVRMAGAFSLKKLVEIFTDYNYHDLSISHGMEAVKNWRELQSEGSEAEEIREQLYEYCGMDTYSMVLVFHVLLEKLRAAGMSVHLASAVSQE